jgi:hypothetical protein
MATGRTDGVDDFDAQFLGQPRQRGIGQPSKIGRCLDPIKGWCQGPVLFHTHSSV